MPEYSVSRAKEEDVEWLVDQIKELSDFYGGKREMWPGREFAEELTRSVLRDHLLIVCRSGDERVGFLSGLLTPHHMNPSIITLHCHTWWVVPDHRKNGAGFLLLSEFTKIGRRVADSVFMAHGMRCPVDEENLSKMGYKLTEKLYVLET